VPLGSKENTTQLVASINSLKVTQKALQHVVQQTLSSPSEVRQKLNPILSRYVNPLQVTARNIDALLMNIANTISTFCYTVHHNTKYAEANGSSAALRQIDVQVLSRTLSQVAINVHTICKNADTQLIQYRNSINSTAAHLNTFSEKLTEENSQLSARERMIQKKLYEMNHAGFFEKIANGFKALFGNLLGELKSDMMQMRMEELEIQINKQTIGTIKIIVADLANISNVASALEISWRNLSDSIGNLEQDLVGITANVSASDWQTDLEYVNSDWQNIKQILANINR
jgi:hypothetical protein